MYSLKEVGLHEGQDKDWINNVIFDIKNSETGEKLAKQQSRHYGRVVFSTHKGGRHDICIRTITPHKELEHTGEQRITFEIAHTSVDLLHYKAHIELTSRVHSNVVQLNKAVAKVSDELEIQIARQHEMDVHTNALLSKVRRWSILTILAVCKYIE